MNEMLVPANSAVLKEYGVFNILLLHSYRQGTIPRQQKGAYTAFNYCKQDGKD